MYSTVCVCTVSRYCYFISFHFGSVSTLFSTTFQKEISHFLLIYIHLFDGCTVQSVWADNMSPLKPCISALPQWTQCIFDSFPGIQYKLSLNSTALKSNEKYFGGFSLLLFQRKVLLDCMYYCFYSNKGFEYFFQHSGVLLKWEVIIVVGGFAGSVTPHAWLPGTWSPWTPVDFPITMEEVSVYGEIYEAAIEVVSSSAVCSCSLSMYTASSAWSYWWSQSLTHRFTIST